MTPQFRLDGFTILDFNLLWTIQAIQSNNPDEAYKYSRQLVHLINCLTDGLQRKLIYD